MKWFLVYALLGLAPNVLAWEWSTDEGQTVNVESQIVLIGDDGEPIVGDPANAVWVSDDDGQRVVVTATAGGDGQGDTAQPRTIKVIARANTDDQAADRGWLGVSIGNMPEVLAAQLDLKGKGFLVLNVVEGSPADAADVEAHDIILSINGQGVSGEVGKAVDTIKSHKPGEKLNLVLLRNGEQKTVNVTLASRADLKEKKIEWKFEGVPDAEVEDHVKTHGRLMMRDRSGAWITRDLGDLDMLKNLPQGVRTLIPESGSKSTQVFVENGKKTIKMHVENDGTSLIVEQADGGEITITRKDASGQETVASYPNEDALKAGDEDAYNLYKEVGDSMSVHVDGDGSQRMFVFSGGDGGLLGTGGDEWRAKLEESLAEAKGAYQQVMEEFHNTMQQWNNGAVPDAAKLNQLHDMLRSNDGWPQAFAFHTGKPKHTFETRADGSIEVRIRKGDSELLQVFKNETDLAGRNAELSRKYQELMSAGNE